MLRYGRRNQRVSPSMSGDLETQSGAILQQDRKGNEISRRKLDTTKNNSKYTRGGGWVPWGKLLQSDLVCLPQYISP